MVGLLVVLVVVIPIVELATFIVVAGQIGAFPAAALIIACSVVGLWLVKREGLGVWRRVQDRLVQGEMPATELLNGVLVLVAGLLMAVPGFVTDVVGLLLLIPPVRALVRRLVFRRLEPQLRAMAVGTMGGGGERSRIYTGQATYRAMDVHEVDADDPWPGDGRPELER